MFKAFLNNPLFFLFCRLWRYTKNRHAVVLLAVSFSVLANGIYLLQPLVVGELLNTIQEQGITADNFWFLTLLLSAFVGTSFGFWLFHGPSRVWELRNAFFVRANYKKYLIEGTMDLPAQWHADHHSGDTIDKIEKGSTALYEFSQGTYENIEAVVRFVIAYSVLLYFNIHASYLVMIMVAFTVFIILKFDGILVRQYRELFRFENGITAKIYDVISNITTVIILRIEKMLGKSIWKKIMEPYQVYNSNIKVNEWKWFVVSMCAALMIFLVLFSYIYQTVQVGGAVMVGTIYILYGYVEKISSMFYRFAYQYSRLVRWKTAVQNAEILSDEFREKAELRQIRLGDTWKELTIDHLNFSYHEEEESTDLHVYDVDLRIRRGEKIAFIGSSGSGKTTVLKILRGLYDVKDVDIHLDGKKLERGFDEISESMALIPQEPEIFASTVGENITMGINRTQKHIRKFTDMARFTDVLGRLPNGLESLVYEKGVNLSGGEKQRLALTRGLMASEDKEIVLLDEATSSVDPKNEREIYEQVFKKFKDKAIVASVHRLHLLGMFDRIVMFRAGRIHAVGTVKELLKSSPLFKKQWEAGK
jgi:ATP-binding cassette subfamily B protein